MKNLFWMLFIFMLCIGCSFTDGANDETANKQSNTSDTSEARKKAEQTEQHKLKKHLLDETITVNADGEKVVTNPDDILVVSNKERNLPENYKPKDLVIPNVPFPFEENLEKKYLRKEAAEALEKMFADAKKQDLQLYAMSGFRSFERQRDVFAANVKKLGEETARRVSASPGQSEHQTGLAMDVTSPEIDYQLTVDFESTPEGKWVLENAHKYGFIIRYPKGKEAITGYDYEPWHLRYVGKEHALYITEHNLTLEEYLSNSHPVHTK